MLYSSDILNNTNSNNTITVDKYNLSNIRTAQNCNSSGYAGYSILLLEYITRGYYAAGIEGVVIMAASVTSDEIHSISTGAKNHHYVGRFAYGVIHSQGLITKKMDPERYMVKTAIDMIFGVFTAFVFPDYMEYEEMVSSAICEFNTINSIYDSPVNEFSKSVALSAAANVALKMTKIQTHHLLISYRQVPFFEQFRLLDNGMNQAYSTLAQITLVMVTMDGLSYYVDTYYNNYIRIESLKTARTAYLHNIHLFSQSDTRDLRKFPDEFSDLAVLNNKKILAINNSIIFGIGSISINFYNDGLYTSFLVFIGDTARDITNTIYHILLNNIITEENNSHQLISDSRSAVLHYGKADVANSITSHNEIEYILDDMLSINERIYYFRNDVILNTVYTNTVQYLCINGLKMFDIMLMVNWETRATLTANGDFNRLIKFHDIDMQSKNIAANFYSSNPEMPITQQKITNTLLFLQDKMRKFDKQYIFYHNKNSIKFDDFIVWQNKDKQQILWKCNIEINSYGIHLLSGKSGTGKSTLIKMLSSYDNRVLEYDGHIYLPIVNEKTPNFVILPQFINFFPLNKTLLELMIFPKHLYDVDRSYVETKVLSLFHTMEIKFTHDDLDKEIMNLRERVSGGELKRLGIINKLLLASMQDDYANSIMVYDEPFNDLDPHSISIVQNILKESCKDHICIIIDHGADNDYHSDDFYDYRITIQNNEVTTEYYHEFNMLEQYYE